MGKKAPVEHAEEAADVEAEDDVQIVEKGAGRLRAGAPSSWLGTRAVPWGAGAPLTLLSI